MGKRKHGKKKHGAFSLSEISITVFLILVVLHLSFSAYQEHKEFIELRIAKNKIVNTFQLYSLRSVTRSKEYRFQFDGHGLKIMHSDSTLLELIALPANFTYYITSSRLQGSAGAFKKTGNLSHAFSIYIFNKEEDARYRISFYSFNRNQILRINQYKRRSKRKILRKNIDDYHRITSKDREEFRRDWCTTQ